MAQINEIQIEQVLQSVSKKLYQTGVNPTLNQVLQKVSNFFAEFPPGLPLPLPTDTLNAQEQSDTTELNLMLSRLVFNIQTLYDICQAHTDEVLMQNTLLRTNIAALTNRVQKLQTTISDTLLSLYNTAGYYYSLTDNFSDLTLTDLSMTTAFVDTVNNQVTIPTVSGASQVLPASLVNNPTILVTANGAVVNYQTISPFDFATNGTSNTVWEIQVPLSSPQDVTVTVTIPLGSFAAPVEISRVDFDPYAMTPFQLYVLAGTPGVNSDPTSATAAYTTQFQTFGNTISTSLNRMSFTGDVNNIIGFQFVMNKSQYDFTTVNATNKEYVYIFGAKDIIFTEQVYDNGATFVSLPLALSADSGSDLVIDAVSLEVNDTVPPNANINFYVAQDVSDATPSIGDFNWQPIVPIGTAGQTSQNVVHFNGALQFQQMITDTPQGANDIQLLPLNTNSTVLADLNPSPTIIPGVDTYLLANFSQTFLANSIALEEGINSTRIYWTPYEAAAVADLTYWSGVINNGTPEIPTIDYGRIDTGNGFFYGGDIGHNGVSAYVETYLYLTDSIQPILDTISKNDTYSQTWSIRIYLNGSELTYLPGRNTDTALAGETPLDNLLTTWNFQQGINHIAVLINIPNVNQTTSGVTVPYIGTMDLLANNELYNFGEVKLADWSYVSFFDLEYNQPGTPKSFAVYNNQIISKSQPTTNYRLTYSQSTGAGPSAIRFRADLNRNITSPTDTPLLNSYSMKFQYGSGA